MNAIKVTLINPADRRYFMAQWDDPLTGKTKTQSTKTTLRREAERFASRLEAELNTGTHRRATTTTWQELRTRYETEVSATKAPRTALKTQSAFNTLERKFAPSRIDSVADAGFISRYAAGLRADGLAEFTIRGHLAEIRKVLRWAQRMDIIKTVPHIAFPRPTGGMKGRPITDEEFARMIAAIELATLPTIWTTADGTRKSQPRQVVSPEFRAGWNDLLVGMYLSGLRLEEAMALHWTEDSGIMVDLSGPRPMLRIQATGQKSRKFQMLPITPDFADFLQKTPEDKRTGYVFNPLTYKRGSKDGISWRPLPGHVGKVVSAIGKAAGIMVNGSKYASAHDLRRAFGNRWAKLVMPAVLMELMRHESISTTMDFYVGILATDASDAAFKAMPPTGNTFGNTSTPQHRKTLKK